MPPKTWQTAQASHGGQGNGSAANAGEASSPNVNTARLDNYVPTFNNVQKDYREFRKRVEIYKKKMEIGGRRQEVVYNVVTMLTGKSWDLVEDMSTEQLAAEGAMDEVLRRLDGGFRYDPLTELPDDFEQFFMKLARKTGQTLQDYMTEFSRAERRLHVTHAISLPEKVKAWWFLRKSGITKEQRQLILTHIGTAGLTLEEVQKAMSFILGQDSKLEGTSPSSRWNKASSSVYYGDADDDVWHGEMEYDDYQPDDDEPDEVAWLDDGQDYYQDDDASAQDSQVFDVDEFDEVYTNYQEARGKLNALRTARGFYPVVAMVQGPPSYDGGRKGKSPPRKGKGKNKGKQMPKAPRPPPDPKGRAAAASGKKLCLRCGLPGHQAKHCPQGSDRKRKADDGDAAINMVEETYATEEVYRMDDDDDETGDDTAVQDGGAASVLGSMKQIKKYLTYLMENGYGIHDITVFECTKGFKYGNSQREVTNRCLMLPMFLGGRRVDVLTYVIQGAAPILIGRPLLEKLGLVIDYANQRMRWPDGDWEEAPRGKKGEYILHLGQDLCACLHREPDMVLMPDDAEDHLGAEIPMSTFLEEGMDEVLNAVDMEPNTDMQDVKETNQDNPHPCDGTGHEADAVDGEWSGRVKRLQPQVLRKMETNLQHEVQKLDKVLKVSHDLDRNTPTKRVIWEVFVGEGRTSTYLQNYDNVHVEVFSLSTGWDFEKPSHRRTFLARLRDEKPDEVLMAPMCRLWSPLQELNCHNNEEYRAKLIHDRKINHDTILTMCGVAYVEQQRNGRGATLEHPWNSRAWSTKALKQTENEKSYDTYVDQCQYGLVLPDKYGQEGPVKKPTCFRTTKYAMYEILQAACDGSHTHVPLEGNIPGGGGPRTKAAESYPPQLAETLARGLMLESDGDIVMAAEDAEAEPLQPAEEEGDKECPEAGDEVKLNQSLKSAVGRQVYSYVARLRKNLGHPSGEVLHRMLTEVQATADVLKAAKEYVCPRCQERKPPAGVPPASGLTARNFGDRLMADATWVDTTDGRTCVMVMMDHATRYVAIRIMKSERSVDLVKGLERGWIKHFSTPKCLRIDEAKGMAAQHLREWCSEHNIVLEIAPAEAHNWIGAIERKHQVIRRTLELYMDDKGARTKKTLLEAAIYCPGQINNLSYTNGYTPAQWVLGRSAADAHSLTADMFNPGLVSMTDQSDFQNVQAKRLTAQTAFLKADTDLRLRRAMMQNFRENKNQISVGQQCYYWRLQGTGILQKNKWRGPCRCVAEERDDKGNQLVLWLCHGTSLLRCAPHQVRPRVEDHGTVVPVDVQAALKDLQELRARSTTQFRDVIEAEAGVEDLLEEEGLDAPQPDSQQVEVEGDDYSPTEPADDSAENMANLMGSSMLYQHRRRDAEEAELDAAEPSPLRQRVSTDAEPEPTPDDSNKRHGTTPESSPSGKRARPAHAIPVPDEDDNELTVDEAMIAEIDDATFPKDWHLIDGEFELDEVYLANLGTRKGEASERTMTLEEKEKMIEAKRKELASYFANKVWTFTEIGKNEADRVISARWVLTWKAPEMKEGQPETFQRRAKARLVLRGFEDPDLFNLEKTSPTASKSSKMLLLAMVPIFGWRMFCGDVRCAFLSGAEFKRNIIVKLPRDCSALLGCLGVTYMKMNKSAYGLSDAPLLWWREADRRLRKINLRRHKLDKCCYMFHNSAGALSAMLILHVDDLLLGCNMNDPEVVELVAKLRKSFDFGKWQSLHEDKQLIYCGGHINETTDGLSLDFESYLKKVMPITVPKNRGKDQPLAPQEVSKARGLIGALQWPAGQGGCPQLCASTSILAATINKGTVELLHDLNKALRFGKSSADLKLMMRPVCNGWDNMCLLCFSDAAVQVRADATSQGGFVICLTSTDVLQGKSVPYSVIAWRSHKLTRVCRSSLSAESQACATALDELLMMKTMLALLRDPNADPRDHKVSADICESAIVIDAKGLYDALQKEGIGSAADKRAGIEIMCIKEELVRQKTKLKWVSSERMLSDGMTKIHTRQELANMLKSGYMSLVDDSDFKAAKKKDKTTREKSAAATFSMPETPGLTKVAERIAMVVALDSIPKTNAAEDTTEVIEYDFGNLFDFAMVVTILAILVGAFYMMHSVQRALRFLRRWWHRRDNELIELKAEVERLKQELRDEKQTHGLAENEILYERHRLEELLDDAGRRHDESEQDWENRWTVMQDTLMTVQRDLERVTAQRNAYRERSRMLMEGECLTTRYGSKWHIHRECQALSQSQPKVNEDLCVFCRTHVVEQTGGFMFWVFDASANHFSPCVMFASRNMLAWHLAVHLISILITSPLSRAGQSILTGYANGKGVSACGLRVLLAWEFAPTLVVLYIYIISIYKIY